MNKIYERFKEIILEENLLFEPIFYIWDDRYLSLREWIKCLFLKRDPRLTPIYQETIKVKLSIEGGSNE